MSRIWGLPFGAHSGQPESVAFADLTTVGFEAGPGADRRAVARVAHLSGRNGPIRTSCWRRSSRSQSSPSPPARSMAPSTADHARAGAHPRRERRGSSPPTVTPTPRDRGRQGLLVARQRPGARGHGAHTRPGRSPSPPTSRRSSTPSSAGPKPLMDRYPTLADAKAAGYTEAGPFSPGLGLHLMPPVDKMAVGGDGVFDTEAEVQSAYLDLRRHRGLLEAGGLHVHGRRDAGRAAGLRRAQRPLAFPHQHLRRVRGREGPVAARGRPLGHAGAVQQVRRNADPEHRLHGASVERAGLREPRRPCSATSHLRSPAQTAATTRCPTTRSGYTRSICRV